MIQINKGMYDFNMVILLWQVNIRAITVETQFAGETMEGSREDIHRLLTSTGFTHLGAISRVCHSKQRLLMPRVSFLSRIVHNSPFKSDTAQQVIFICELQDDVYVKLEADGMSPRISLQEVAAASGRPRGCVYFR